MDSLKKTHLSIVHRYTGWNDQKQAVQVETGVSHAVPPKLKPTNLTL
jgi:hypothetical protein